MANLSQSTGARWLAEKTRRLAQNRRFLVGWKASKTCRERGLAVRAYNGSSMRRGMAIAAFALMLAVPLWAQHGGGHGGGFGGGGHAGGFGGGHAGGFSGGGFAPRGFSGSSGVHAYSAPRSMPSSRGFSHLPPTFGFSHPPTGGFTPPTSPLVRQPFASNGFGRGAFGRAGFGRNRFGRNHGGVGFQIRTYPYWWGYGWGYPYWGWNYFDPWWSWWDTQDNSYDNSDDENNVATAAQMNDDSLREQQMLQQEQANGDQDAYQGAYEQGYQDAQAQSQRDHHNQYGNVRPPLDPERMQQAEGNHGQIGESVMRPTVLVFRDQHKQEVENYAIVGETLWNFSAQQTVKIPLSEIDIPATVKANQDRGVTFSVPAVNEGQ